MLNKDFGRTRQKTSLERARDLLGTHSTAMLTSAGIVCISIDEEVLKLIPEIVARRPTVLPVRFGVGTLHVVLPKDADRKIADTIATLEFTLDHKIACDSADRDMLATIVDLHYNAMGSVVQKCPRIFVILCSKRWVDLERIGDDRVEHCDSCDAKMRLCKVDGEIDAAALARGECVAYCDSSEAFLDIKCAY